MNRARSFVGKRSKLFMSITIYGSEMFSKNVSFACGIAVYNTLVSEWGDA